MPRILVVLCDDDSAGDGKFVLGSLRARAYSERASLRVTRESIWLFSCSMLFSSSSIVDK